MLHIKNHAANWRDFIIDIVFPIECLVCGRGEDWLCPECRLQLDYKPGQCCLECKTANEDGRFCPACRHNHQLDGVIIAGDYDNELLALLIKRLKYSFIKDVAAILGDYLVGFTREKNNSLLTDKIKGSLAVTVPLHRRRELWRGFNQARLIANRFAVAMDIETDHNRLVRIKNNRPQAKLNEADRKANISDCFIWTGVPLSGRNIIIIDDVVTTGATLDECARVLKKAGAGQVWGLVLAKG